MERGLCATEGPVQSSPGNFLSPHPGLFYLNVALTHGLRRGLHSCAPSELGLLRSPGSLISSHLLGACALLHRLAWWEPVAVAPRCGPVVLGRLDSRRRLSPHSLP